MKLKLDKLNPLYLIAIIALVVGLFFLYKRNKRSSIEKFKGPPIPSNPNKPNKTESFSHIKRSNRRPKTTGRPTGRPTAPPKFGKNSVSNQPMMGSDYTKPSSTGKPWKMEGGLLSDVTKGKKGEVAAAGGSELGSLL